MINPTISVCLPTRNSRAFLQCRINSILRQTYPHWEVVSVDSQSDDGTVDLLRESFPPDRIRFIQNPPGLYDAWNRSVTEARGDLIHFATSDDYEDPRFYETMVDAYLRSNAQIVHSQWSAVDSDGTQLFQSDERLVFSKLYGFQRHRLYCKNPIFEFLATMLLGPTLSISNAALIQRELFDKVGLFPTNYGGCGDWAWYLRASFFGTTCCLDEHLAFWRIRRGQATVPYARVNQYRQESQLLADTIRALENRLVEFGLNSRQLEFVTRYAKRNGELAVSSGLYFGTLRLHPDKMIHAFTKLFRPAYAPFVLNRRKLEALVADLPRFTVVS